MQAYKNQAQDLLDLEVPMYGIGVQSHLWLGGADADPTLLGVNHYAVVTSIHFIAKAKDLASKDMPPPKLLCSQMIL